MLCYAAFAPMACGGANPPASLGRLLTAAPAVLSRIGGFMADPVKLAEVDRRILVVRENIRVLTEQAAAYSGAADEERNADRIAEQDALLTKLLEEREALAGKG